MSEQQTESDTDPTTVSIYLFLSLIFLIDIHIQSINSPDNTRIKINDTSNPSIVLNEKFIHYLAKKVPEMFMKLQMPLVYPIVSSISADDIHNQNHSIISSLVHDYIQTTTHDQSLPLAQLHK